MIDSESPPSTDALPRHRTVTAPAPDLTFTTKDEMHQFLDAYAVAMGFEVRSKHTSPIMVGSSAGATVLPPPVLNMPSPARSTAIALGVSTTE